MTLKAGRPVGQPFTCDICDRPTFRPYFSTIYGIETTACPGCIGEKVCMECEEPIYLNSQGRWECEACGALDANIEKDRTAEDYSNDSD